MTISIFTLRQLGTPGWFRRIREMLIQEKCSCLEKEENKADCILSVFTFFPGRTNCKKSSTSIKTPNAVSSSLATLLNVYYWSTCGHITKKQHKGAGAQKSYFDFDISANVRCYNRLYHSCIQHLPLSTDQYRYVRRKWQNDITHQSNK